tara:strand:+ start:194 stop:565 length:372 start_codon:yes stop_codon:yes gene_type:complete
MNYELAKQLKDAGFPMRDGIVCTNCGSGIVLNGASTKTLGKCSICECETVIELKNSCVPTLSELIEACGDGFSWLGRRMKMNSEFTGEWIAGRFMDERHPQGIGTSAEEAVANLYLKLHELKS